MKNIPLAILTFLFIVSCKNAYCQITYKGELSFVESTASVNLIDSEYLLVPKLIVKSKNEKIKIHRSMYYGDGTCDAIADGRIYLQKQLRTVAVNISMDGERHRLLYDEYQDSLLNFGTGDSLKDTINLKYYYPFEIGHYRLRMEIDYYYKNKKHTSITGFINFDVPYLPKNPLFY